MSLCRFSSSRDAWANRRPKMTIGSNDPRELAIVFIVIILTIGLLVVIDRLGTLRRGELDEDEEEI
jgi:hypothetical protein